MSADERNYRKLSRRDWQVAEAETVVVTGEHIQLGCTLRIADALETIAKSRVEMEDEIAALKCSVKFYRSRSDRLENRNRGLRGRITVLNRKIAEGGAE